MELDGRVTAPTEKKSPSFAKMLLWLAVLVVGLPAACTGALMLSSDGEWEPTEREAQAVCQDWVEDQLKSPTSAKFSGVATTAAGGQYEITGQVDAENGFGATVRTPWTCSVRYDTTSEEWRGSARVTP